MRSICLCIGFMFVTVLAAEEPSKLRLVADLLSGTDGSSPTGLFEWNGKVWFRAYTRDADKVVGAAIYCTDGSTSGTQRIKDFPWLERGSIFDNPVVFENRLYFQGPNAALGKGSRVWVTDGTEAGTRPVSADGQDVCDEARPFLLGERLMLFVHGNHGKKHDLIALNLRTGVEESIAVPFDGAEDYSEGGAKLGKRVLIPNELGTAFWSIDGTREGLKKLSIPDMPVMQGDDSIKNLVSLPNGVLLLPKGAKQPWELWHTDGTAVAKLATWSWPQRHAFRGWFGRVGDRGMLLFHDRSRSTGLWSSDGTKEGSKLVIDLDPYKNSTFSFQHDRYPEPVVAGGLLFFVMDDGKHGLELWRSDGTQDGTHLVTDMMFGDEDAGIQHLYPVPNGQVLMECRSENLGQTIWITDGTDAGTRRLAVLGDAQFSQLTVFKNMLLMQSRSGGLGDELYALDLPAEIGVGAKSDPE